MNQKNHRKNIIDQEKGATASVALHFVILESDLTFQCFPSCRT